MSTNHNLRRYKITLGFLQKHLPKGSSILDLGTQNQFSEIMRNAGYIVNNTKGEDLDLDLSNVINTPRVDVVTAFEIFEHLVSPFPLLKNLPSDKLIATIPLRLWFASAYKSKTDHWDRHFHEFEDWQFDWLLDKAGWKIVDREKWTSPTNLLGIRPLLRRFTPRFYAVYAVRK